jgi:2-iminoacetate synthase ThiH
MEETMSEGFTIANFRSVAHGLQEGQFAIGERKKASGLRDLDPKYKREPAARLMVIRDAGAAAIPFTSGILIGIGETRRERLEALLHLRDLHDTYKHLQEVIIQNFRGRCRTASILR